MITPTWLVITSITSQNYFFVVGTFKIYSLSNFQVYNTVLLTVIAMLYITTPEHIHHITGSL